MAEANLIPVLSDAEVAAIEAEAAHVPFREAAAIEALRIVQEARGWISDESLHAIARLLGMPSAELDSIATFYNLVFRQPVGRHVVWCCDSVSCYVMGADRLKQTLIDVLGIEPGQTTEDDRYTLLPICCLGACDHAPVLMVDKTLHHDVPPDDAAAVRAVLEGYA